MTDTLLALVPVYGNWLVMVSVALSCLALPIPSSMLVMAAGGFAAAGDLVYWHLLAAALAGFVAGDQIAYHLARAGGAALIARLGRRPGPAAVLGGAQDLLDRRGLLAVFLSRTVLSPLGPYVGYLSGALGLDRSRFSAAAAAGAVTWCLAYSWLGYAFAERIAEIAALIANSVGLILALAATCGLAWWLRRGWRAQQQAA